MAKRVVLHIGLPKAGSSSIQLRLAGARVPLRAAGIGYPLTDPATGQPLLDPPDPEACLPQHMRLSGLLTRREGQPVLAALLGEFEASGLETLVLSSESFVRRAHLYAEDALARLHGYDVAVVLFVRRRDQWLLAMYKQAVRAWERRWRGSFDRWLDDPPHYEHNTQALRLADMAERMARLGGGRLHVVDLDDRGDAVAAMGELLGVELGGWPDAARVHRPGTLLDAQRRGGFRYNASPGDAATLFLAMIDADALERQPLRELETAIVAHGFGDAAPRLAILSPERSAALVAGGAADRARLGLAPVTRGHDTGGLPVRRTLTLDEWLSMAAALVPMLAPDLAAALGRARITELH